MTIADAVLLVYIAVAGIMLGITLWLLCDMVREYRAALAYAQEHEDVRGKRAIARMFVRHIIILGFVETCFLAVAAMAFLDVTDLSLGILVNRVVLTVGSLSVGGAVACLAIDRRNWQHRLEREDEES